MFSNIRSVVNKRDDLCTIIDTCDADILVLTETWLNSKISNEILNCEKDFITYRCDRGDRIGGGVLIAVADHLHSSHVSLVSSLEIVCASIRINHRDVIFCACYRPPNAPSSFCSELHDVLNRILVRFPSSPIFLLGDFNMPKIIWSGAFPSTLDSSPDSIGFINLCTDFNFSQLITQPTRITTTSANILDLVLTTLPELVHSLAFLPGLSDHSFIQFDLKDTSTRVRPNPKYIRVYSKANFPSINAELEIFLGECMPNFYNRTVETNWRLFKEKVHFLVQKHIPLRVISGKQRSPWFTAALKRLLSKKNEFIVERKPPVALITGMCIVP